MLVRKERQIATPARLASIPLVERHSAQIVWPVKLPLRELTCALIAPPVITLQKLTRHVLHALLGITLMLLARKRACLVALDFIAPLGVPIAKKMIAEHRPLLGKKLAASAS
jgi:hypothetical protein